MKYFEAKPFWERFKLKNVTMADVAKKANVSKSTVSQFLNKRYEYMSEETKLRIAEAIETLGYQPNVIARSLKQKKTSTIGVIVANILHSFSTQVIRSIEDVCNAAKFNVIVCNADDDPEKEKSYIEMLLAKQVDGLIIFPTGGNYELYKQMAETDYPLVFVDRLVDGIEAPAILLDNESAAELAVKHLYDNGYRRIGMLTTSIERNVTPRIERLEGYKKSLLKRGMDLNPNYFAAVEIDKMDVVIMKMFHQPIPPDAIIAGNDLTLLELLSYVKKRGIRIPEDFGLISIDEVSFSHIYSPALTIVSQPAFEIGKKAGQILLNQIETKVKYSGQEIRFKPELVIRESARKR